ncbi:MAG: EamA family transporter RarD [Devosia sp.]|nr:EamA family transporter RarD [Devosia sp.]
MASIDGSRAGGDDPARAVRSGVLAGITANAVWGFLPLLFYLVDDVDPFEVVAVRTACSLVIVAAIVLFAGRLGQVRAALSNRRIALTLMSSALLLAINWVIYVYAVQSNRVLEGSFGYFINPMVNVFMGMVFLGERHSRWQTIGLALALVGIAIQAIGLGGVPFISLGLALSFGTYGYLRKTVKADATNGLFIETLLLTPFALAYIVYSVVTSGIGPLGNPRDLLLLLATGPATATPLLFYAFSVQRLRLTTAGMLQYIAPSIQFFLAITFFGEHLNGLRLVSFMLVWVALAVFSAESFRQQRAQAG